MIEALHLFSFRALSESLITPLELKMEEWKKVASQLDKDHAKEYKKARADIKKKSSDTIKLQKKVKKGKTKLPPSSDIHHSAALRQTQSEAKRD
ncbi:hypothetical protein INR49_001819 [Caranx melampygus]|nr:hypothetical protein INR49_001819 [Caranx melampygus]